MLINSRNLVLVIVFSHFALCICGNNNGVDTGKVDLTSTNLNFHEVNQRASTSNPDRGDTKNGICVTTWGGCGGPMICFCCARPHGYCVPTEEECEKICS
ncbi:hypothetical protein HanIR_Chr06g0261361 [Helianthus annuus]|nr:hypothetical protein HanIR_Chr06g0261361 [Helianthus annuus]